MVLVDTSIWVDHLRKVLSYIDIQLLASARLSDVDLWTSDKKLNQIA